MFGSLDISTSALIANRVRQEVAATNIANAQTLENAQGEYEPFRRRFAVLATGDGAGGAGVHVRSIETDQGPLTPKYEPGSPYADENGYVDYPNVQTIIERMNAMERSSAKRGLWGL